MCDTQTRRCIYVIHFSKCQCSMLAYKICIGVVFITIGGRCQYKHKQKTKHKNLTAVQYPDS